MVHGLPIVCVLYSYTQSHGPQVYLSLSSHPPSFGYGKDSHLDQTLARLSELFFNYVSPYGLVCSSLHHLILATLLLSQFSQNPPDSLSDHPSYISMFLIFHDPPGDV